MASSGIFQMDASTEVPTLNLTDLQGSTTEEDSQSISRSGLLSLRRRRLSSMSSPATLGLFARLIPINNAAKSAVDGTADLIKNDSKHFGYHNRFLSTTTFNGQAGVRCFELSLAQPPQFPHIGWRIGSGRQPMPGRGAIVNRGVDLLLHKGEGVAGIHARLNWVKGAGGFFLIADNKRGRTVMINGEIFANDCRAILFHNALMIGECLFTLQYIQRSFEDEEQFQVELKEYFANAHQDGTPLILATPGEIQTVFGEWIIQYPISRGSFGVVSMVTHARNGRPAALKQLLKFERSGHAIEREVRMARRISKLTHDRIASPFEIIHQRAQSRAEIERIRSLLDHTWDPSSNATDLYIIISPLLSATFKSLYTSSVSRADRVPFFAQLLEAVAFLHSEGICHRDIKPDNILVKTYEPPDIKLTDFGSASDQRRIYYDFPGTIPYLAPEQQEGRYHGFEVDYWACALVGVRLLGMPRQGRVLPGPSLDFHRRFCDDASNSTSPIAYVCKRMLEEDPARRMTAAAGLEYLRRFMPSANNVRMPSPSPLDHRLGRPPRMPTPVPSD